MNHFQNFRVFLEYLEASGASICILTPHSVGMNRADHLSSGPEDIVPDTRKCGLDTNANTFDFTILHGKERGIVWHYVYSAGLTLLWTLIQLWFFTFANGFAFAHKQDDPWPLVIADVLVFALIGGTSWMLTLWASAYIYDGRLKKVHAFSMVYCVLGRCVDNYTAFKTFYPLYSMHGSLNVGSGGRQTGRADVGRLVRGCIEAKFCDQISVFQRF